LRARLAQQGADVSAETGAAYGKLVADETARWKKVVEAAGIPPQQGDS
jgi:tripartite-type tricarboxylate transporter receptor subunit TctC